MNESSAAQDKSIKSDPRGESVYSRSLRFGGLVTLGIAIIGSVIGYLVVGVPGILSALMGAGLAMVFMGVTAVSIVVAARVTHSDLLDPRYFGIVLGAWLLKLVVFVAAAVWLRSQTWLDAGVFSIASITAVVGLLIADVAALQASRVPYVDVPLPGDPGYPAVKKNSSGTHT